MPRISQPAAKRSGPTEDFWPEMNAPGPWVRHFFDVFSRLEKQKGHTRKCSLLTMERAKRFELSTLTLARLCSTPELRPLDGRDLAPVNDGRKSLRMSFLQQSHFKASRRTDRLRPLNEKRRPNGRRFLTGAGEEIRTLDPNLGKVMLYP